MLLDAGLIDAATLHLQGETRSVALKTINDVAKPCVQRVAARPEAGSLMHA